MAALESFPLKLEAEVVARIKSDAAQLGIPSTRYARQLIHAALQKDEGEEIDRLRIKLLTVESKLDRLTDISIDSLAALLRTLAVDEKGNTHGHTAEQANAFIEQLKDSER